MGDTIQVRTALGTTVEFGNKVYNKVSNYIDKLEKVAEKAPKNESLPTTAKAISPVFSYGYEYAPKIKAVAETIFNDAKEECGPALKQTADFILQGGLMGAIIRNMQNEVK